MTLFRTMKAQTPSKAAQKEAFNVTHAISFVNDIPGMYAGGIAYPARDPIPNLTQDEVQKDHNFSNSAETVSSQCPHSNKKTNNKLWTPSARWP